MSKTYYNIIVQLNRTPQVQIVAYGTHSVFGTILYPQTLINESNSSASTKYETLSLYH